MENNSAIGRYEYDVINFSDWGNKGFFADENLWPIANKNTFAAHISSFFDISEAGSYDFASWSDDGIALLIDGQRVINRPHPHAPTLDITNLHLNSGIHNIDVIWYENRGAAVLELSSRSLGSDSWELLRAIDNPNQASNIAIPEPHILWLSFYWLYSTIIPNKLS